MSPSIIIDSDIRGRISTHLRRSGKHEVGGILLGEQIAPSSFRLVDFSIDNITGSDAHFHRSPEQHNAAIERFFKKTRHNFSKHNYLGEWHSHPRFPVSPSPQDYMSMQDLVRSEKNILFAALLIVRLDFFVCLKIGATMFSQHRNPEHITIERSKT